MGNIAGKFFNRSQKTDRGDYEESSVAKFSDYDSNENPVGEGRSYRGGFGYKAKVALLGLMALGFSGCGFELLPRFAQPGFYRDYKDGEVRDEERVSQNQISLNQIRTMPKVIEFNFQGKPQFLYDDGKGNRYFAELISRNDQNIPIYTYNDLGEIRQVPTNALEIFYQSPDLYK